MKKTYKELLQLLNQHSMLSCRIENCNTCKKIMEKGQEIWGSDDDNDEENHDDCRIKL